MSFGGGGRDFSDDQYVPEMISSFDTEPWPGLWDTTRSDIFKMATSPCFACDGPNARGLTREQQYGPPFRPRCVSSGPTVADVKARYPDPRIPGQTGCVSCGANNATAQNDPNADNRVGGYQNENYVTFGPPSACTTRQCVSQCGNRPGCSCMGMIGCRRLPEGPQIGVFSDSFCGAPGSAPMSYTSSMMMLFLFVILIVLYIANLQTRACMAEARGAAAAATVT